MRGIINKVSCECCGGNKFVDDRLGSRCWYCDSLYTNTYLRTKNSPELITPHYTHVVVGTYEADPGTYAGGYFTK